MIEYIKYLKRPQESNAEDELEKFTIKNLTKSIYPEEEISNVFKKIIFKTNTEIIKYPKVSNSNLNNNFIFIAYILYT